MHVLLITLSNIGDVVLATPVIELLMHRFPGLRFDIAGDARSLPLLAGTPGLRHCFSKDKSRAGRGAFGLLRALRRGRYDLTIDLRSPLMGRLTRCRRALCVPWGGRPPGRHAAQDHVYVVRPLFGAIEPPPARLHLPPDVQRWATARLEGLPRPRIAIAPGANWAPKIWPSGHYAALMQALAPRIGSWVVLGSEADREAAGRLLAVRGRPLLDAVGGAGLLQAAALLAECDAFVGNDSGLGHVAAAVGLPTLTVFGPGQPERYRPWGPRAAWLVAPGRELAALAPPVVERALDALLDARGDPTTGLQAVGGRPVSSS
jgi:ADP-heptose:LPS heptosyltransferase